MQIFYCDRCGLRVPAEDLKTGRARQQEGGITCSRCLPGQPEPKKTARRTTSSAQLLAHAPRTQAPRAPAAQAKPLPYPGSESVSKPGLPSNWLLIFGALGAVGLIGALLVFSLPDPAPEKKRPLESSLAPRSKASAPASRPSAGALSGPRTTRTPVEEPPPPPEERASPESRGREAFEKLIRFEGLEAGDEAGRKARLEAFLQEYADTIVAGRALALLNDLKRTAPEKPPAPPPPAEPPAQPTLPAVSAPPVPPAVTAPPAAVPPRSPEEALGAYRLAFLAHLRGNQTAAATSRLAEAEKDPALSAFQADLALDRKALLWLDEIQDAVPAGLEKLKDVEAFDLVLTRGEPFRVGRQAPYQVTEVKDGAITLTGKGVSIPVALDKLTPETLAGLSELGLGADGRGQLKRAFAGLLGDAAAARSSADLAKTLQRAQAAGAAAEESAYVLQLGQLLEKDRREAAAAAWNLLLQTADGKRLAEGVENFQKLHGGAAFALDKEKDLAALLSKAKSMHSLTEGLVGYWTFDEGQGAAASDSSGRGHQGKLIGSPNWTVGRVGGALNFTALQDGVTIKASPDFLLLEGGTVTAWIKPSGKPFENGRIVQKGDGKQKEGFLLALASNEDRLVAAVHYHKAGRFSTPKGSVPANAWCHAALVFTKEAHDLYIDGVKQSLAEEAGPPTYTADPSLRIGYLAENAKQYRFHGSIDEVRLYNRPLSEEEVKALAKAPAGKP